MTDLCASDSPWDNQLFITAALPPLAGWVLHLKGQQAANQKLWLLGALGVLSRRWKTDSAATLSVSTGSGPTPLLQAGGGRGT